MSLQLVMIGLQLVSITILLALAYIKIGRIETELSKRKSVIKVLKENKEKAQLLADSSLNRYKETDSTEERDKYASAIMELEMINTVLNFME